MSALLPPVKGGKIVAIVPFLLVGIVLLMVIPLPAAVLDLLLAASIALSVTLMLISIYLERPLDLSAFPTILLFATLLRLALNVASTRLILLHGAGGTDAAGDVIRSFGEFVVGGNYVVGATVFILLVIINFVVITKGAGRVAEVSARFTLDALPGKQMSIDADMAAGVLTQEQAKRRRREIEQEADFFGAMDGASKFVRGDAIAGLLMTGINIVVGFIVGVAQQDMSAADAASTYTVLTVGDGLASQIPALLISAAAGVVVTRAAAGSALSTTLVDQLGTHRPALYATAAVLFTIGLLPGMPVIPFFVLAGAVALAGRNAVPRLREDAGEQEAAAPTEAHPPTERERLEEMLEVDLLELEVGFDLVPLVDAAHGGDLVERIAAIRRNLAADLGVIVPSVHIRDNLRLGSTTYRLLLSGTEVGSGDVRPGRFLAMDPTGSLPPVDGEEVREPAFGLPARWVREADRERAEAIGYTIVDPATVAATHLTEMLRGIAPDLLGRTEAQELIDLFAQREPKVVDELIPNLMPLGDVIAVLRELLSEGVSIRDLRTILEALADNARVTKNIDELVERVRHRLARHITQKFRGDDGKVPALVLDPRGEEVFRSGGPDAISAQKVLGSLDEGARAFAGVTTPPLLICAPDVRRSVSSFLSRRIPGLSVLSFREIDAHTTVRTLGMVTA
ncbi:MAG: flagellar biosynthesis protein FlhA [Myxococcales bacterium]|nr:flagellar biosynthesis protein FlhA [Myxococcales bacterium]